VDTHRSGGTPRELHGTSPHVAPLGIKQAGYWAKLWRRWLINEPPSGGGSIEDNRMLLDFIFAQFDEMLALIARVFLR
jgi:hypothetical protein